MVFIIDNSLKVTSKRACSIMLQREGCVDPDRVDWTIEIPPTINFQKKRVCIQFHIKELFL